METMGRDASQWDYARSKNSVLHIDMMIYWPFAERAAGDVASLFREFSFSFPLFPRTKDVYHQPGL